MDSGNSGSMQSSSCDEEYDSRSDQSATAPPVFLNPHHYQNQQEAPTLFDIPSSSNNYLHPLYQSQSQQNSNPSSSFFNLDLVAGSRTNRNNNSTVNLQGSSSAAAHHQGLINHGSSSMQSRLVNDQTSVSVKNPKKRTRTSRRAPTTVLTTDASNFRAMVQEFTGIPAQPFSVGSSYSRRLDLFKLGNNLEPMGPINYPLRRPTTQKFQPIPSFVSSSIGATTTSSTITTTSISGTNHNSTSNYQLLSDLGLKINNKEPQNILNNFILQQNLNHPVVSFQSLLQHSAFNPSLNITDTSFGVPSFADHHHHHHHLGMSHASIGLTNQDHLRSFEGNFGNSSQRVTSCKLNYSASSSDFHHDKNLESNSSRGEGTVDSWICPSD